MVAENQPAPPAIPRDEGGSGLRVNRIKSPPQMGEGTKKIKLFLVPSPICVEFYDPLRRPGLYIEYSAL
jgi:hypothetical protein